jgi:hypothetical protein
MGAALWRRVRAEEFEATRPLPAPGIRFRYCITVFGELRGPWRDTAAQAIDDAITLELASWDESQKQHFLAVPVGLKVEKVV